MKQLMTFTHDINKDIHMSHQKDKMRFEVHSTMWKFCPSNQAKFSSSFCKPSLSVPGAVCLTALLFFKFAIWRQHWRHLYYATFTYWLNAKKQILTKYIIIKNMFMVVRTVPLSKARIHDARRWFIQSTRYIPN
jgi:hypothetical protein